MDRNKTNTSAMVLRLASPLTCNTSPLFSTTLSSIGISIWLRMTRLRKQPIGQRKLSEAATDTLWFHLVFLPLRCAYQANRVKHFTYHCGAGIDGARPDSRLSAISSPICSTASPSGFARIPLRRIRSIAACLAVNTQLAQVLPSVRLPQFGQPIGADNRQK